MLSAAPCFAFEHLVVLGDSLSDSGNAGRFSDGPVWVEQLADRLNIALRPSEAGGTNFAVGGARVASGTDSVRAQLDRYLGAGKPSPQTLFVVYGGGNDVLGAIGSADAEAAVRKAGTAVGGIVAGLARHGAQTILVPNLPDVGITPSVRHRALLAQARVLTVAFNRAVDDALRAVPDTSGIRLLRLDVFAMGERVKADPQSFGFSNIESACSRGRACDGYLFWDDIHPTSQAHGHLAEAAWGLVSSR